MNTPKRWHQGLAARYGMVVLGFVATGSLMLLAWLHHQHQDDARRVFVTLAQNDVDFVRRHNLPRRAKLAEDLSQLLRVDVHFRSRTGPAEPALRPEEMQRLASTPASLEVILLPAGREALVLQLDEEHDMVFIREAAATTLSLWHPTTLYALAAFWLFSALFAWILGQQVVRPVRRLTRGLPDFFGQQARALPGAERRDEIGALAGALTKAREDLTAERERREQSERLALLGRVATGLAHEIKNPLASIQLHAQLVESTDLDADSQTSLRHLLAEVSVIEGLVNQWLYLARPAPPKKQKLELLPLLEETVRMLSPQAAHAGVKMHLQPLSTLQGQSPSILGDRQRLQQVFRNVILNAIQAMPSGGQVEIRVEQHQENLVLTFRDEGGGFSNAALSQGTDLFFSEKEGGMGVGLNVGREIISVHHGQFTLQNHPAGGAVVEITLPMSKS